MLAVFTPERRGSIEVGVLNISLPKVRMKNKIATLLGVLTLLAVLIAPPASASPSLQSGDPVAQCTQGVKLFEDDKYAEALPWLETGFANRDQAIFADPDDLGKCALALGKLRRAKGDWNGALDAYSVALAIFRSTHNRKREGSTLNNIGAVYDHQGRYAEALDSFQQALVILREVGDRVGEGTTLNNIGLVYDAQGRYAEALDAYQQSLVIARKMGDSAGEGTTLNNIGLAYDHQGRHAEALASYQQALVITHEVGDRAGEGATLNNIGVVYHHQGRYTEALDSFQQALVIRREVGDQAGEGTTLNNIGEVYRSQGRYAEVLDAYQQALVILREVGVRVGEGTTLNNIGAVYQEWNELPQALAYYKQAIDVFETVRSVAGSESGRASFIAQYAFLYNHVVSLYHAQGQDDKAFYASERGRARAFLDSLATGHVELSDNTGTDLLTREQEAYATRQATQDALAKAKSQTPSDEALITDLEAQLAQAETDYQAALKAIEDRGDQLAALVPGRSGVLDLPQVQALLDDQTTLISFWVLEDQTLAFIVTHNTFDTIALKVSRTDLAAQINTFSLFASVDEAYPASALTLYNELIAPLNSYLTTPHLTVVPQGVLHYLPFAALTDGQRYVVDDYTVTYFPSASTLPYVQKNLAGTGGKLLVLGNPATDLPALSFAEREARAIGALYGVEAVVGEAATESLVHEQASEIGILHLAAHGYYNTANPLYSAVALTPDRANDGQLEVSEIYGLNLGQASLVVLSACETQKGELSTGDERVGLTRAFFFAGAPTVIASLWSVDDEATELLMERFYTHLRAGQDKAAALRQAQLDVREEYPNPYYWAAFVLNGDPGAIDPITVSATPTTTVKPVSITATPMPGWKPDWTWAGIGGLVVIICGCLGLLMLGLVGAALFRRRAM
jgi:CHAT domain-containing protein/Tfp pilus assembly protein PilF